MTTKEKTLAYISECDDIEDLGEILENVKGRLEGIKKFLEEE